MYVFPVIQFICIVCSEHRLNIELDLQNLFGLHVHRCTHRLSPQPPPPPPPPHLPKFGLIYEGAIGGVSQDRRHLLETPWLEGYILYKMVTTEKYFESASFDHLSIL